MKSPRSHQTADVVAVTELFEATAAAWAAGNAAAYADCFTHDADYVTFVGTHLHGHEQIQQAHAALWESFQKNTRLHQKVLSLRFVTPDVAVLVSEGSILQPKQDNPKPGDRKVQTLVAVREPRNGRKTATDQADRGEGGWRFTSFQNTKHRRLMERFAAKKDKRIAPEAR